MSQRTSSSRVPNLEKENGPPESPESSMEPEKLKKSKRKLKIRQEKKTSQHRESS